MPEVELLPSRTYTSLETLERGITLEVFNNLFINSFNDLKVRQFLEKMGRIAFFRSGNEPIVLNDQQREARKAGIPHILSLN